MNYDIKNIKKLVQADIESLGCFVWGIETVGTLRNSILRIFIDKDCGVTLDDCETVSRHVSKLLESNDYSLSNLTLEVSSPGIERKFFSNNQYDNFIGSCLKIRFRNENKYLSIKGILRKVESNGLTLKTEKEDFFVDFNSIERASLEDKGVRHAK